LPDVDYFTKNFKSFLKGLTEKKPERRLGHSSKGGAKCIITHKFFKDIEWDDVLFKKLIPPIIPRHVLDNNV
jgi:protein-serine/threonine kinase